MSGDPGGGGKLWGGRFAGGVSPEIDRFTRALAFDRRLGRFDLIGSLAHARMLSECGVLGAADAGAILGGLAELLAELERGTLAIEGDDEDVHSWIERALIARVGEPGRRLHTGRSRNDQTAVALRLWLREEIATVVARLAELIETFLEQAREHRDTVLPGYTHLQRGQPVTLAHHLLAHLWSLDADAARFVRAREAAGVSPLGAGALAGTPHPIDPARSAELLGLPRTFRNSMHAVADRDYVLEASFAAALLAVHLSRWAEEVVLWSSAEFSFVRLDDSVAKGSSLMPQKKNPEPAELLRGKAGRVIGDLVAHLVQLKGLPLTYNSDLQEDKEALFDALDTARESLVASRALARGLRYQPERMRAALEGGFVTATDLADAMVRRGAPFRDAHERTGRVVRLAEERGVELWQLPSAEVLALCPELDAGDLAVLAPDASVAAHRSPGGPAPERVTEQLDEAALSLAGRRAWLDGLDQPPILRAAREGRLLDAEL
ncbi:MAG TPA: argininosuccinate lyase [Thermoanaerobaculia bacterium]|nr:argininosuccinate lyase [Thermoanaerobaculia bacterium]